MTEIIDSSQVPTSEASEQDTVQLEMTRLTSLIDQLIRANPEFYKSPADPQADTDTTVGESVLTKLRSGAERLTKGDLPSPAIVPLFWGVRSREVSSGAHNNHKVVENLYVHLAELAEHGSLFRGNYYGMENLARALAERGDATTEHGPHKFLGEDIIALTNKAGKPVGLQFKVSSHAYAEFTSPGLSPEEDFNGISSVNIYLVPDNNRVIPSGV